MEPVVSCFLSQSLVLFWKVVDDLLFAMPEYFTMYVMIEKHSTVPSVMIDAAWKEGIVCKAKW